MKQMTMMLQAGAGVGKIKGKKSKKRSKEGSVPTTPGAATAKGSEVDTSSVETE